MLEWMLMPYRRYADFSGRSRRKEYWMFTLFSVIVAAVLIGLMFAGSSGVDANGDPQLGALGYLAVGLLGLWVLGSLIPSIAVTVRRFHDQDKSGWFYLLSFIPYVGGIVVFVFMLLEGTRGPNRFGADPKDPNSTDVFS
ncbi:MAG: DUF805 domain-containing protein [Novosphingobium sp.]|uniref:DUF805 domain-containing protein n=1 Tax=Novosphingobium sp. TaxID=1874826 RepID=UPI00183655E9|nr:DUF805 domain-containing protein [Novosphingobium sp.]